MTDRKVALRVLVTIVVVAGIALVLFFCWSYVLASLLGLDGFVPVGEMLAIHRFGTEREKSLLLLTAVVPAAGLGFVLYLLFHKSVKLYGDARFGTSRELSKSDLFGQTGVFLGRAFGRFVVAPNPGNVLVSAPPGGMKTTAFAIPTALSWHGSMVVTDLKLEIYEKTAGYRAKCGQEIYVFAPLSLRSHCWNPFANLRAGPTLVSDVYRVASFLITSDKGDDMWSAEARALFVGIALHVFSVTGHVTVGDIYEFCRDGAATWDKCKALVDEGRVKDDEARKLLGDFGAKPPKEASGVKSTLTGGLVLWNNPIVRSATSRSDFALENLRRTPTTIYIGVRPTELVEVGKLLALFYQQLVTALCGALPKHDEPHWVLLNMDEFAAAGQMELIKKGLAFLRGYKVRAMMFIQSPAQLDEIYGPHGRRAIFDTSKTRVFFQPNDYNTAKDVSAELGTYTTASKSRSISKGSRSTTTSSAKRELLNPDEVMRLGVENAIVFYEGMRPFLVHKVPYFADANMTARASIAPPDVPLLALEGDADAVAEPPVDVEALLLAAQIEMVEALAVGAHQRGDESLLSQLEEEIGVLLVELKQHERKPA